VAKQLKNFSGIYPHLAMYNAENECGTGAKGHAHIDKRIHPYWLRIRTAPGTDAIADFTFR